MFKKVLEDGVAEKTAIHTTAENPEKGYDETIDTETMIESSKSQSILSRCSTWW